MAEAGGFIRAHTAPLLTCLVLGLRQLQDRLSWVFHPEGLPVASPAQGSQGSQTSYLATHSSNGKCSEEPGRSLMPFYDLGSPEWHFHRI